MSLNANKKERKRWPKKPARKREIKIRLTDDEHAQLLQKKTRAQLANWIRAYCLQAPDAPEPEDLRGPVCPPPVCDPALLRQLAGIGNNLNQVARRMNSGEWTGAQSTLILATLKAIDSDLGELLDQHRTQ